MINKKCFAFINENECGALESCVCEDCVFAQGKKEVDKLTKKLIKITKKLIEENKDTEIEKVVVAK